MITREIALQNKEKIQIEGRDGFVNNGFIGVAEWVTGVGKTRLATLCVSSIRRYWAEKEPFTDHKILFVVPTITLRDIDVPDEFYKWDVSMEGITVVCYASLKSLNLYEFDFVIFDEYHNCSLEVLRTIQDLMSHGLKILCLSATLPSRLNDYSEDGRARFNLLRNLVPVIHKVTIDEAISKGLIKDFEIILSLYNLPTVIRSGYAYSARGRYDRITETMEKIKLKDGFSPAYKRNMEVRRDLLLRSGAKYELAERHLARMKELGRKLLVFSSNVDMIEGLVGKENTFHAKNRTGYDRFQNGESDVLGAIKALNEGINLVGADAELMLDLDNQKKNLLQRIGRSLRIDYNDLGKKALISVLVASDTVEVDWFYNSAIDINKQKIKEFYVPGEINMDGSKWLRRGT